MKTRIYIYLFTLTMLVACVQETKDKVVGIVVLNDFEQAYIDDIITNIESYYKCKCILLNSIQLPKNCITTIKYTRYRADSIIRYLRDFKPDSVDYILGLTNENISNTQYDENGKVKFPESYFIDVSILGLGFRPGKSCVVSSFNFWNADSNLAKTRLKKIAIHELGHNFGLPHCKSKDCVIQDGTETLKILDESDTKLCRKCSKKINRMIR